MGQRRTPPGGSCVAPRVPAGASGVVHLDLRRTAQKLREAEWEVGQQAIYMDDRTLLTSGGGGAHPGVGSLVGFGQLAGERL